MSTLARRSVLGSLFAFPATTLCRALPLEFRCRFRIRAALEASGVAHTAASVIEVLWTKAEEPNSTGIVYHMQVWGEAPYVNIKGLGNVFVLLVPPSTYVGFSVWGIDGILAKHISYDLTTTDAVRDGRYLSAVTSLAGEYSIPEDRRPRLVTLSNGSDLGSVALVDDGGGSQVRIRDVTLAVTRNAVTRSIENVLPWLQQEIPIPQLGLHPAGKAPLAYRLHKKCFLLKGDRPGY